MGRGKVRLNPDPAVVRRIREGLKARGGFCPCRPENREEYRCICEEFRRQMEDPEFEGFCHCRLYYKSKEEPETGSGDGAPGRLPNSASKEGREIS